LLTSVELELEMREWMRMKGMTIRGVLNWAREHMDEQKMNNSLVYDLKAENKELKKKIERLSILFDDFRTQEEKKDEM